MSEIQQHPAGTFCWFDMTTTDVARARAFYGALFGWTAEDVPMGGGEMYTMFKLRGRDVGACSPVPEHDRAAGIPPHWNLYVSVDDVDAATKIAEAAGAKVLAPPFAVFDVGRMAVIADPAGAALCLWQAGKHPGIGIAQEPGAPVWAELMAPEPERVQPFYARLFGWTSKAFDTAKEEEGRYLVQSVGEQGVAGIMKTPEPGIPPNWMVYFQVSDCAAAVAKVRELGGEVHVDTRAVPGVGRFAVLSDPMGATFAVLEPQMQPA